MSDSTARGRIHQVVAGECTDSIAAAYGNRVNDEGFSCGTADEIFGPKTDGAVRRYQQGAGLAVDGVAGPNTMKKLAGVT